MEAPGLIGWQVYIDSILDPGEELSLICGRHNDEDCLELTFHSEEFGSFGTVMLDSERVDALENAIKRFKELRDDQST
jgi:hypothetical protein